MCGDAHWSKVAVLKRAYNRKPTNGYCANPEAAWRDFDSESVSPLEDVLRFMHVESLSSVKALGSYEANKAVSAYDVMAADTSFKVSTTGARKKKSWRCTCRIAARTCGVHGWSEDGSRPSQVKRD